MKSLDLDAIASDVAKVILREEFSTEKEKQDSVSREIKGDDLEAPEKDDDDKKKLTDEGEDEEESVGHYVKRL